MIQFDLRVFEPNGLVETTNQQLDGEDGIIEHPAAVVDIMNLTCFWEMNARPNVVAYYLPKVQHGSWKWWFPKGISFSTGWFSGSMLSFRVYIVFYIEKHDV